MIWIGKICVVARGIIFAMVFAQLTYRESLRDIEICLVAQNSIRYHLGFSRSVRRTTLADANEQRDWRFFAALGERLIARTRKLYEDEPSAIDLDGPVYAMDSTMIGLSMALCPWANWTNQDAAVKTPTLLDLRTDLPAFVVVSEGNRSDQSGLDEIPVEQGSYYVLDRAYIDLRRLGRLSVALVLLNIIIEQRADSARCIQNILF